MTSLHGLKVLITRPAHQAKELVIQTQNCGGIPITFPTLEVVDTKNIKKLTSVIKKINQYDFVFFISPNSVFKTATIIHDTWSRWPSKTKTIATGPGTMLALKQFHLPGHYYPDKDFNGIGLLELIALKHLKQKKILIIKGEGGRLYLAKNLKARGAHVDNLIAYRRQLPKIDKKHIPDQKAIDVIICTSHTGLKNLISLLYPSWQNSLFEKQLLVISHRLANNAKKLGFVKPLLISDNASNIAILQTLFSWREQSIWNLNPHPT